MVVPELWDYLRQQCDEFFVCRTARRFSPGPPATYKPTSVEEPGRAELTGEDPSLTDDTGSETNNPQVIKNVLKPHSAQQYTCSNADI